MASQEAETFGVFFQKHLAQISMTKTYFSLICNGAGNAERLQSFTDGSSSICSAAASFLNCNGSANRICPAGILKADGLNFLYLVIYIQSGIFGDFFCFLDGRDAVAV